MSLAISWRGVLLFGVAFIAGGIVAAVVLEKAAERGSRTYLEVVRFGYVRQESEVANAALAAGDTRAAVAHAYCAAFALDEGDSLGEQAPPWHAGLLVAGVIMPTATSFGPADPVDFAALQRARLGFLLERSGDAQASQAQYELADKMSRKGLPGWRARAAASFSSPSPGTGGRQQGK